MSYTRILAGIGNRPQPVEREVEPKLSQREVLRPKIRWAVSAVRALRAQLQKLRDEVERLEAAVEANDYPSFQTESFRNDDLMRRAKCLRRIEELEAKEPDLMQDLRLLLIRRQAAVRARKP